MKQSDNTNDRALGECDSGRRWAYLLTRGVFLSESTRFSVVDQTMRVLGGVDEATFTLERDPRETHPHLFFSGGLFGALFDLSAGPDETYFARLETLAALASDPEHARRALNIAGDRQ